MTLAGAFADAMYGCSYNMIKQKFVNENEIGAEWIEFPQGVIQYYGDIINEIKQRVYEDRFFFKKNDALTNVERHIWKTVDNTYSDLTIDDAFKLAIMRAYHTGWEQRYGVYFDNGWFYVYRSHHLLLRFKLVPKSDNTYRISNLQISNDNHARVEDLGEVIYTLKNNNLI